MKVLVVENNAELLKLLTHILEMEGFETTTAVDGREAREKFAAQKPDIACLDIMLGDASGYDICREMRGADEKMPILLITSKSRNIDVDEGMQAGATEYIIKPFDMTSIRLLMRKVACDCIAAKAPQTLDESFDFGDVRVFPGRLMGQRDGNPIGFSLREVSLLKLFHRHQGQVVANDSLLGHCWKAQDMPGDKAVEWQIKQLRKKIEADPAHPALIRSEGTGYRFGHG